MSKSAPKPIIGKADPGTIYSFRVCLLNEERKIKEVTTVTVNAKDEEEAFSKLPKEVEAIHSSGLWHYDGYFTKKSGV